MNSSISGFYKVLENVTTVIMKKNSILPAFFQASVSFIIICIKHRVNIEMCANDVSIKCSYEVRKNYKRT